MADIKETLRLHAMWIAGEEGGVRANLYEADLRGANLRGADLCGADLYEANLRGADLWSVRGNGSEVKSLQIDLYDVTYTSEMLQIGCQRKPVVEWFELDSILGYSDLDSEWVAFKPLIKQIIEQYPATTAEKEDQNG